MTLVISKGITLRKGYIGTDDPDAEAYIAAVEAADEAESPGVGALETATKVAIHSFVKGCKNDGIWPALKASCILAGARTLAGALVPLVGAAPTNAGGLFVSDDYNRKTGLVGDGSTKSLNANYTLLAELQNNAHISIHITAADLTPPAEFIGNNNADGSTHLSRAGNNAEYIARVSSTGTNPAVVASSSIGFFGASRNNPSNAILRVGGSSSTNTNASATPLATSISVFKATALSGRNSDARLSFYSIGESLDLALLDARVTDLINAFAAAIP
jgi:hypothetical protein